MNSTEPTLSSRRTNVEVPKELPKVSMVNTSLKKLKHHLADFDVVVKERTTPTAITEGSWGFEHTKACFRDEIIPFVKALKDLFKGGYGYYFEVDLQSVAGELRMVFKDIARLWLVGYVMKKELILEWSLLQVARLEFYKLDGFVNTDNLNHMYKLKKALYGLKEDPRACPRGIFINQSKYALESLKKYDFDSCDPVDTPMVEKSKLDEDKEGKVVDLSHYRDMIDTLLYLIATTVNRGLWYPKDSSIALTAFADADHAGCQDTHHSTSGSMQFLGDRLVSWLSKRQKSAAISNTEAEYIAMSGCCSQILWMRSQITDYGLGFNKIHCYTVITKKAIVLGWQQRSEFLGRKHIDIRFHFSKSMLELGDGNFILSIGVSVAEVSFTKALAKERIEFLINKLGMQSFTLETLKHLADEVDELSTIFKPKEPTFQVALDVFSLTPFYPAFLITSSVPAVYMHEFWATASYHKHSIIFKLNTKRYSFDMDTFRNMLQICPKLPGQQFVDSPFEEEILTFMRELGYPGNIKLLSDVKVDILPQP
ncbi:hypothetical protein Tco_0341643 [Tanacetum coccineum]